MIVPRNCIQIRIQSNPPDSKVWVALIRSAENAWKPRFTSLTPEDTQLYFNDEKQMQTSQFTKMVTLSAMMGLILGVWVVTAEMPGWGEATCCASNRESFPPISGDQPQPELHYLCQYPDCTFSLCDPREWWDTSRSQARSLRGSRSSVWVRNPLLDPQSRHDLPSNRIWKINRVIFWRYHLIPTKNGNVLPEVEVTVAPRFRRRLRQTFSNDHPRSTIPSFPRARFVAGPRQLCFFALQYRLAIFF